MLSEYLFAGSEAADDLLVRLYAGFLHPLIQMMYGLEWKQPAIIAEALAQTCVHQPNFKDVLLQAERNATLEYAEGGRMPTVVSLLEQVRGDQKLAKAVRMEDDNKVRDGVLTRAPEEMLKVISKVKVSPEQLEERTAEMYDAALFTAASASFHAGKVNKFDFFLMWVGTLAILPGQHAKLTGEQSSCQLGAHLPDHQRATLDTSKDQGETARVEDPLRPDPVRRTRRA